MTWEALIPATRGRLPNGAAIPRIEPGGDFDAPIVILGVYPAARVAMTTVAGKRMNLPGQVERTSFELGVSASAKEIDTLYLEPLAITRDDVLMIDVMPYFLANTRKTKGRSMADNIREYERLTGQELEIEARPPERQLVELARTMPGNLARIADYLTRSRPRLLLTLGSEAAAFVRGVGYDAVNDRARELFYSEPAALDICGVCVDVVHLAHPGLLMSGRGRTSGWRDLHAAWCDDRGRTAVATALRASDARG